MIGLRDAIRAAATDRTWSQGVTLARDHRVVGIRHTGDETELEVRVPGRPTPFNVILNAPHEEWECDCTSREAACSHVVAAVLAVLAMGEGEQLPVSDRVGATIRYVLAPSPGGVSVERVLVHGERTEQLVGSLVAVMQNSSDGSRIDTAHNRSQVVATRDLDLVVDQILTSRPGPLSGDRLDRVLGVLADARDVRWGDKPVHTDGEPVVPQVIVHDGPDGGARVRLEADPEVIEVVALGVVRMRGDVLRPVGAVDLGGARMEKLPTTYDVPRGALPELMSRTLPALAARLKLEIRATGLPEIGPREPPRMQFDVVQDGDKLVVFPLLVYGSPPRARVDAGRLVHLHGALPVRDLDTERRLVHRLRDELNMVPGRRVELFGKDAFATQQRLAVWLRGDAASADASRAVELAIDVKVDGARVDVVVAGGGRTATIGAALRAWQAGVDLVPLDGGGWGRVPLAWLDKHGARVADLLACRGGDRRVPLYALPDLAKLCADLDRPPPAELARIAPLLHGFEGIPSVVAHVTGELRPYQQRGVDWLVFCRDAGLGCVLADDMGLGKTVQALAALRPGTHTLVVTPTSVLFNWLAEARRFRPDLTVSTYHGARRVLETGADIVVTTYPLLRNDIDKLASITWDAVVLDESQTIKNPDSQVARAAYQLQARWRVTLSGTPIENRLDELWSQVHFTNPGLLGGRADFQARWAEPIGTGDDAAAARLRERIRPFVLRRLKRDVAAELPPRTDSVMYVELDDDERVTYDAIRAATQREVVALLEAGGGVMAALEALLRLRQAACHKALLPTAVRGGPAPTRSSKLDRLLDAVVDLAADGHRALVFSQWTSLLDLIEPHLESAGIGFVRLDGSTVDRAGVVAQFQADDGPPVMLLSLKAGGTGLNLTAADHVFLVDPWWNPAVEDQAADRAHRIGQDKPVLVYRLVARDTVEERILELQDRKRALADAALSEAGRAVAITRDDLLALLA